jgi:UDP-N-acetylglucosamine 4,6-dehydratase/5-epimerase
MNRGEIVLVTGGTGSFGRHIISRLLKTDVGEIRVFSRDEEKQLDMQREISDKRVTYHIGDVRDYDRINEAMCDVTVVYHAAALKIITTGEIHPNEHIKTNITGTQNVKKACTVNTVRDAVFISTDKAVKPINLYGMTKAVAEKVWVTNNSKFTHTNFSAVRYGNVIGSRGSIVPFFKALHAQGKPIPITHPDMTRFLITLDQAINLVFRATGERNTIWVPHIPAANVMDIVEAVGGKDYPTEVIGIRPGEKIHECLINEFELTHTRIEWATEAYIIGDFTGNSLHEEYTSETTKRLSVSEIKELL